MKYNTRNFITQIILNKLGSSLSSSIENNILIEDDLIMCILNTKKYYLKF